MRGRLVAVALATTVMVALAFVVPLAVLVRSVARDRALSSAERDAAALAPVLAVTVDPVAVAAAVANTDAGRAGRLSVFLAGGARVGPPVPEDESLELARRGSSFFAGSRGGTAFFLPVLGTGGTSVVRVFVPATLLERGVTRSWTILVVLGVVLVAAAVIVADRLAVSVVRPVRRLAEAADRLGGGDLTARVEPDGPVEVAAVGRAFNLLSGRVGELLEAEREMVADLSHRLRTPLTVLRLEVDSVAGAQSRERLRDAATDLERAVSQVIEDARRPIRAGAERPADLCQAVRERAEFWGALAEEQGREWQAVVGDGPRPVTVARAALDAALDALLGNIFAHTPEGTSFSITVEAGADGGSRLIVDDAGPGLPGEGVLRRGRSGGGSTGLGLDIARRTAEAAGGRFRTMRAPSGGARIELEFPAPAGWAGQS